ncbi:MAG: squalene/phytoene synthase family protein [Anaerolineae bacterium]|nr:squalene/phytoene synthase family protein [Anaerolineae bacterium]
MKKVSRSFALVVPCLEPPLNHWMATAYLLCRVVDNVEDCLQPTAWKRQRFAEFERLLAEPELAPEILSSWQEQAWPGLTPDEQQLMILPNGHLLWQIYAAIPAESQTIIRYWTQAMALGMSQLEDKERPPHFKSYDGVQVLSEEADYNTYCYYVAGTVGHMSTELVIQHYDLNNGVADTLRQTCEACGRGLQKTNIVKDFAQDLARGICYLPATWLQVTNYTPLALQGAPPDWAGKVLGDVVAELQTSTQYVLALPYEATGYRMASLLCLLPAFETLLLAAQQHKFLFTANHHVKISRQKMAQCLQWAQGMIDNNAAIEQYSHQRQQMIKRKLAETELVSE